MTDPTLKLVKDIVPGDIICAPYYDQTILVLPPEFPTPKRDYEVHKKPEMHEVYPAFYAIRQEPEGKPFWYLFRFAASPDLDHEAFLRASSCRSLEGRRIWLVGDRSYVNGQVVFPCWFQGHPNLQFSVLK